jgi:hypothetical protein
VRRLGLIGTLLVAVLGLGPGAAQAEILDASCPLPTNGGSTSTQAQTFTAVHTGTLVRGEMFVAKSPGSDFQMQILNAGPSGPTGTAIGTTTIPDSSIENVPSPSPVSPSKPADGTFNPGVPVIAGQEYAIYLKRLPGSGSYLGKDYQPGSCPGREWGFNQITGVWSTENDGYDFPFSTYVNPTNAFTIGKVKGSKVTLTLPGRGGLDVAKSKLVKATHTDVAAAGTITLRIHLKKSGKSRLRSGGKVKASITFTPEGGLANTLTAKLK